jgi:hypothetical protein
LTSVTDVPTSAPQSIVTIPPPTRRPAPTAAPASVEEIEFVGVVESTGAAWTIGGTRVEVTGETEIRDQVGVGALVRVRALRLSDGRLIARRIQREDDGAEDQNSNQNPGDDNRGSGNGNDNGGSDSGGSGGGSDDGK